MSKYLSRVSVLVVAACLAAPAVAGGTRFRCGNSVIKKGDTMYKVARECGEPEQQLQVGEKTYGRVVNSVYVAKERMYITEWVYYKGDFVHILTFEGSTLKKMDAERT